MKLGTTTIPIAGWVIDPTNPQAGRESRLKAIKKLVAGYGLSAVELTLDFNTVYPHIFNAEFYESVAQLQKELGFVCTVHLPFMWLDCASINETIRQASVECIRQVLKIIKPIYAETYVLHLWGNTTIQIMNAMEISRHKEQVMQAILTQADHSIKELKKLIYPLNLCVENLEAPSFDFVVPLIEKHNVSVCLDVGHLAYQGGGEIGFLDRLGDRMREVHLHDALHKTSEGNIVDTKDHLALGEGQIDYRAFMQKLIEVGFDEIVILENNSQYDLERSIARVNDYF